MSKMTHLLENLNVSNNFDAFGILAEKTNFKVKTKELEKKLNKTLPPVNSNCVDWSCKKDLS